MHCLASAALDPPPHPAMATSYPTEIAEHLEASIFSEITSARRIKRGPGRGKKIQIGGLGTGRSPSLSTISRTPKLRDSCDACSMAKIRCTRKKPTCTRCGKRGISCEYIATKRAGRPSRPLTRGTSDVEKTPLDSLRSDIANKVHVPSPPSSRRDTPPEGNLSVSPQYNESPYIPQQMTTHLDALPDLVATSVDYNIASSALTPFDTGLDGFFASLGPYSGLGTPPHEFMFLPDYVESVGNALEPENTNTLTSEHGLSPVEDSSLNVQFLTSPPISPNREPSTARHVESVSAALFNPLPCSCLMTALGLLRKLLSDAEIACVQTCERTSSSAARSPITIIRELIAENQRTVETMDGILQCSCSQDVYILGVLSIVVFKVLDRYSAAGNAALTMKMTAKTTTAGSHDQFQEFYSYQSDKHMRPLSQDAGSSSLCVDTEDFSHVAAQMILSELHHAQRLVNTFVTQLKGFRMDRGMVVDADENHNNNPMTDVLYDTENTTRLFFTPMINQMEADLQRRLRNVSMGIVDIIWQI